MKNPFRSARIFFAETVNELKKASWPNYSELKDSTMVVIVAVILLGTYISIVDFSLFEVVNLFTSFVVR